MCRTRAIDREEVGGFDAIRWAGGDGYLFRTPELTLAARGVAQRLILGDGLDCEEDRSRVDDFLATIEVDDEVGRRACGPLAMGSLPFDAASPGHLIVPAVAVGVSPTGAWVTTVQREGEPPAPHPFSAIRAEERTEPGEPPDSFSLVPVPPHSEWLERVASAISAIHGGALEKVVLARTVCVEADRPILVSEVLGRLAALYPSCAIFSFDGFLGASPELLVRREGRQIASVPLAGTVAHSGDPTTDAGAASGLLASAKERHEHEVAVREVAARLSPLCDEIDVPDSPAIVSLRNVSHLGTQIRGLLSDGDGMPSALDLAAALHPTPAVAGTPREAALEWLAKLEGSGRGHYAGPVGWVDAAGDGEFVVGIRCATVEGHTAQLFTGVGVVADSDPASELAETQLKLQAVLAALVRP